MAKATQGKKSGKKGAAVKSASKKAVAHSTKKGAAKPKSPPGKKAPAGDAGKATTAKTSKPVERSQKSNEVPAATQTDRAAKPVVAPKATRGTDIPKSKSTETETGQRLSPDDSGADDASVKPSPERAAAAAASTAATADPQKAGTQAAPAEAEPENISELDGVRLPTTRGRVGVFGGPKDHSAKPDDKLALPAGRHFQYERIRSLDARGYYCAMRWDYRQKHMSPEEGKRWWANKKILITNPANGKAAVVRAVDYGPHENTGLAVSISPGAADAIGVNVGDEVEMVFADQKASLGPLSGD